MAWDAPCRSADAPGGLPPSSERHLLRVDEVKINNSQTLHTLDSKAEMSPLLSPIHEETRILPVDAPLQVTVTVRFCDPAIRSVYSRTYFSSRSFRPTERICRGLLRRISHCSEELITRKDADALNPTQCIRKGPKQLRFELVYEIHRKGQSDAWAWRIFKSYQKHALTRASAKEVVRSTHTIVGIFLGRHDENFKLTDEPVHEYPSERPETFKPSPAGPLDLTCVPRSRFIESSQSWESVPGYSLELTLKSSNPARYDPEIRRTVRIDSSQAAPLTLCFAEDLLWQTYRTLQDVLDKKKNDFDLEHASCDGFNGLPDCDCQHLDEDALHVQLLVVNNLGPIYDYLSRSIQSRLRLFAHPTGQDVDDFVRNISTCLRQSRDRTDQKVEKLNDFDFRVSELTGHGWQEKNCARFIIDGRQSHSRRSIDALLERIRTSVCDVLRGHDVAIRMVAYKRGHLILDKGLIARDHQSTPLSGTLDFSEALKRAIVAELKTRINRDINLICEDTCSLEEKPGEIPASPERRTRHFAVPVLPSTPRSFAPQSRRWSPPGSPGSFATRPPTPPQIPPRMSSVRVFPLVPAKYKQKKERPTSEPSTARDSSVGMGFEGDYRALNGAANSESAISSRAVPAIRENRRENALHGLGDHVPGLRPAAEVYPALKAVDCETDSSSTHSSLPALTESDSPSPEPSMLVTPNFVRSASPSRRGAPFYDDADLHHLSGPLLLNSSAPNSATFSDVERFAEPKVAEPRPSALDRQPKTPNRAADAENSLPVDTPKAPFDCSGDEKTPLAHRQLHGPSIVEVIREPTTEFSTSRDCSATNRVDWQNTIPVETDAESVTECIAATSESSKIAEDGLPIDGVLCFREDEAQIDQELHEDQELVDAALIVAQCDSSETLRPLASPEQRSIDDVAGLMHAELLQPQNKTEISNDQVATGDEVHSSLAAAGTATSDVSDQVPRESEVNMMFAEAESSVPTEESDNFSPACVIDTSGATMQDELSRTKPDYFEHDGESVIGSEGMDFSFLGTDVTVSEAETRSMGVPESSEHAGHVIPFSDSGVNFSAGSEVFGTTGPEFDQKHPLSTFDTSFRLDGPEASSKKGSDLLELEWGKASAPSDRTINRLGDDSSADSPNKPLNTEDEASISSHNDAEYVEQISPVPSTASSSAPEALPPPKTRCSVPVASRSVSNPSPAIIGLVNNSLLPPLPIFGSFTTNDVNIPTTRDSWSSSSSWEDYLSEGRRSGDSVDTVRLSPLPSEEEDGAGSPKRLGTPTAGLLGLHESRWAELGLRTALTGTHAFDRPSTASLSDSPKGSRDERKLHESEYANKPTLEKHPSPSSPRKAFHVRHKTSVGSIPAGRSNKEGRRDLTKKESKDLKKVLKPKVKHAVEESTAAKIEDESGGRFPRAMMLVAGLAFASSVVSRNHS